MKYEGVCIAVKDVNLSKKFYQDLFDLEVFQDYGINVSFGGLSLQQEFDWLTGVPKESILEKAHNMELYFEEDDETEKFKVVTSVRGNSLKGLISTESPLGKAIMGKKTGDRVEIKVSDSYSYYVVIKSIENTHDDGSDQIRKY